MKLDLCFFIDDMFYVRMILPLKRLRSHATGRLTVAS